MFRLWLHVVEFGSEGEPVGEALEPIEVADVDELADVEVLLDRLLSLGAGPDDHPPGRDT